MPADSAPDLLVRPFTLGDIATVVSFRTRMFRELGWHDEARLAEVEPLFASYLEESLPTGSCSGWIAEFLDAHGELRPAGTVVLVWQRVPPGVRNLGGVQVYALGMYVVPEYRRRGVARTLMQRAMDCASENGASLISLHASDLGRPLYEQLGFADSHEMRYFTEHATPSAWRHEAENSD